MYTNGIVPQALVWNLLFSLYKVQGSHSASVRGDRPRSFSLASYSTPGLCRGLFHLPSVLSW